MNTARTKPEISLKLKIWEYFLFFTAVVFLLLWFFQIVFLENFYEGMKITDVKRAAIDIIYAYGKEENYSNMLTETTLKNDMCIEVSDKYNRTLYSKDALGKTCLIHGPNSRKSEFIETLKASGKTAVYYKEYNSTISSNTLILVSYIGSPSNPNGYLIINTPLVPIGSTASIIKRQLITITFFLIVIGITIAFFMSRRISEPITRITKSAEQLVAGHYDIKFEGQGYLEIQQLASTLTYASQEISRVDSMQKDLIANVSHDIRTPLTMLKAYAEMIRDISGNNPKKRNEHLDIIIEETDRLALLVNDILDLSKLEAGKQNLNYSEFSITELMKDIIARYDGISKKSGYNIHFTSDSDRTVKCDIIKIQQVIYNLINNAINYTGEDKAVYVRQINKPKSIRIEVSDTGPGITQEDINLIFDKYYRSENHKREVVGTGLGLSIVKAILKKHSYDFGISSVIGQGSTFWFEITDIVRTKEKRYTKKEK